MIVNLLLKNYHNHSFPKVSRLTPFFEGLLYSSENYCGHCASSASRRSRRLYRGSRKGALHHYRKTTYQKKPNVWEDRHPQAIPLFAFEKKQVLPPQVWEQEVKPLTFKKKAREFTRLSLYRQKA